MHIRLASKADLEDMTAVLVGASPLDPVYPYRFPGHLYSNEFAALCRRKCAEYLDTSTVVVCELPVVDGSPVMRVVAFSAWDMPAAAQPPKSRRGSAVEPKSPTSPTHPSSPTTIGDLTRQSAFRAALEKHKAELFDTQYGGRRQHQHPQPQTGHGHGHGHVFLKILLTHPHWQKRGAGTALASWGIAQARALGVPTTVFASPMGLTLYRRLGFREVGRFRVQLAGEPDFLEIPALVRPVEVTGGMREAEGVPGLGLCGRRVGDCFAGGGGAAVAAVAVAGWSEGTVCA
ncbi:uncharacterized protein B0H64DRAFT_466274 [Chaetomium fimeti]|uniref:N-acetyltransferase domain-containing protein n=1 Tax=Chaetomium fimeti TaxID=1854472 RepID=A0AAE0LQE2_9PEZI|nr:hypothetical protein B0H64DRAFT_466274 [Chaetomium fimeti]